MEQFRQTVEFILYCPTPHGRHAFCPDTGCTCPALHGLQTVAPLNTPEVDVPAVHAIHVVPPALLWYLPASHAVHAVLLVVLVYDPVGHAAQTPGTEPYLPVGHSKQPVAPAKL